MLTLNLELINIFVWFGNNEKFVYSIHSLEYFLLCVWLYKNLLFFFCLFFNEHTHTNLCMRFSKTDELMKEWRAKEKHTDTNHIRIKNDFFCPLKFAFSVRVAIKTHSQKKCLYERLLISLCLIVKTISNGYVAKVALLKCSINIGFEINKQWGKKRII